MIFEDATPRCFGSLSHKTYSEHIFHRDPSYTRALAFPRRRDSTRSKLGFRPEPSTRSDTFPEGAATMSAADVTFGDHIHSNLWHVVARTGVSQTNLRRDKIEFGKIELFGLFEYKLPKGRAAFVW